MPLPTPPKCPMCGAALPISKAWLRAFSHRGLLPWREFGVRCERCRAALFVIKGRATVVSVGLILLGAVVSAWVMERSAALLRSRLDDSGPVVLFIGVWLVFLWIQMTVAPRFCKVRSVRGGESIFFPLDQ